jgi:hypothetical protein
MRLKLFLFVLALLAVFTLTQCHKEKFTTDGGAKLEFSRDTIFFDTVFSTIGSTTQYLKVFNKHNESIRISEIILNGSSGSQYRMNVDGIDGPVHRDVEILPNDSIFIFVEVTIDPGNQNLPFIVEDFIHFVTNGNEQDVILQAWGQDAHFHGGLNSCGDPFSEIITSNEVWENDKPHVIYGIVAVDQDVTLTINAGVKVYCHGKSGLYIAGGSLNVLGELNNEVVFQGDRLESYYQDITGQWGIELSCPIETGVGPQVASIIRGGIWIYQSPGSHIEYAIIKNGNMGIQVDTTGVPYNSSNFSVSIENTKILNMAGIGLWGQGGSISGKNLLIGNCGQSCGYFSLGGKYQMDNCTFANYSSDNNRTFPTFALNNYYEDVNKNIIVRELINCDFNNCIMYGNNANLTDFNEFLIDLDESIPSDYLFRYCLVDTDINVENGIHYFNMTNGQSPALCDPAEGNFKLLNSAAMNGDSSPGTNLSTDIDGATWNPIMKGCYNFVGGSNPCGE